MTDEQLIEEAAKSLCRTNWGDEFTFEEDREYWVNQARAALDVFEKAHTPTVDSQFYEGLAAARRAPCIRAVPGSVIPCCGEPTGDYPDAEGQHALRHPDDWVGADD